MSETTWKPMKGRHAQFQTAWVTVPPVVELVGQTAVVQAAQEMLTSIVGPNGNDGYDTGDYNKYDDEMNVIKEVDDWNDRVTNAVAILKLIIGSHDHDYNLLYRAYGVPAGIICLSDMDPAHVSYLVSHPGADGSGGTLIELACDWSERMGKGGRLDLYSYDKKSTGAYSALGFIKDDGDYDSGGDMTLDPATSKLWTKAGQNWKLARHVAKKYLATQTKPLPTPLPKPLPHVPPKPGFKPLPKLPGQT